MRLQPQRQDSLWKHMTYTCAVRLMTPDEYRRRTDLLQSLLATVNDGSYAPAGVWGFLSAPKGNGVARFIPVFSYADTAIYFACVQHIDRRLASAAAPQTFGGWELGNARRVLEEKEAIRLFRGEGCPSMPTSCYNRAAWMQHWQKYWKLLAAKYEHARDDNWFAMFDVANFYDSVDLFQLEAKVRAASPGQRQQFAVNVLFNILASWNKALCKYRESGKGLPMDLVGDCSRLLANFYLVPFDRSFRNHVRRVGGDFMRFADDMVVCAETQQRCQGLVYCASEKLHELGLNINVAKVRYCSKEDFERFWGFVIMDQFEAGNVIEGLSLLRDVVDENTFGRGSTALKRAISVLSRERVKPQLVPWRQWVRNMVLKHNIALQLSREQLLSLIRLYDDVLGALNELVPLFLNQPFTQPKAILLRALEAFQKSPSTLVRAVCAKAVREIAALDDPVLNLTIRYGYADASCK